MVIQSWLSQKYLKTVLWPAHLRNYEVEEVKDKQLMENDGQLFRFGLWLHMYKKKELQLKFHTKVFIQVFYIFFLFIKENIVSIR